MFGPGNVSQLQSLGGCINLLHKPLAHSYNCLPEAVHYFLKRVEKKKRNLLVKEAGNVNHSHTCRCWLKITSSAPGHEKLKKRGSLFMCSCWLPPALLVCSLHSSPSFLLSSHRQFSCHADMRFLIAALWTWSPGCDKEPPVQCKQRLAWCSANGKKIKVWPSDHLPMMEVQRSVFWPRFSKQKNNKLNCALHYTVHNNSVCCFLRSETLWQEGNSKPLLLVYYISVPFFTTRFYWQQIARRLVLSGLILVHWFFYEFNQFLFSSLVTLTLVQPNNTWINSGNWHPPCKSQAWPFTQPRPYSCLCSR